MVTLRFPPSEVVFVLFPGKALKEDRFTTERKHGDVRDTEVNSGSLVVRRVEIGRLPADELKPLLAVLVDGSNLVDLPLGEGSITLRMSDGLHRILAS